MADGSNALSWPWNEMLEEFRALGGVAGNIGLSEGRGLVAVNPAESVLLRVPRNLLIRADDIEICDGHIRIRESADVSDADRRFFEKYESAFSWGAGERARSAAFIAGLDGLPAEVRELLIAEFGLGDLLQGDLAQRIQTHFMRSHEIPWHGGTVMAPLLELANRGMEGLRYERGKHLQIQGYVRNEILVRYGAEDAYSTFCRFGIAARQSMAFGLPMTLHYEDREIVISRNTNAGVMRGNDRVPRVGVNGRLISFSYAPLGHRKNIRLARGVFRTLLREAGVKSPDEAFDRVVRSSTLRFIKLLRAMERHEGEMISTLRRMARHQLEAINCSIGARELGPSTVSVG
jgi:hypothetical protein